ncbi:hypothetical protein CQW23_05352 [Capsicum baccatum]|uniref:Uncharacterized protein n=1 Tax=Capsicum baccatum TaxID=33114 RepID=A0A2G2XH97_CAPBA|nr:hypothetical protein CQW23_05352 [Capsicum baccatum]
MDKTSINLAFLSIILLISLGSPLSSQVMGDSSVSSVLQTWRGYLQCFENMVNFRDQMTPYPLLEIANDERYSPASVLTLKIHPPVIGVFPLDRASSDMYLHLDKWSTKEEINVLYLNKVINTTAFVLHSSTHDKESATTYPKGSNKGLATWNYPQSGFGEFHYVTCYWEWVEDVLSRRKEELE